MIISDKHLAYIPIARMREMLDSIGEKDRFGVTRTYAVFGMILCWTVQRLRKHEKNSLWPDANDRMGEGAWRLWKDLESEAIEAAPWSIRTSPVEVGPNVARIGASDVFADFSGFTAKRFLTALRHAVAHGDGRRIEAVNGSVGERDFLVGYRFKCNEKSKCQEPPWEGNVVLKREDMVRIGCALADRFCETLSSGDQYLAKEASQIPERDKAA